MLITTEKELEAFGEELGRAIAAGKEAASIFALVGELGSGKTTFTRGFARGFGVKDNVTSPTFVLAKRYRAAAGKTLWHVDAYRLYGPEDLPSIGFEGMIADPDTVIVLEWADRVRSAVPDDATWIAFKHDPQGRTVQFGKSEIRISKPE